MTAPKPVKLVDKLRAIADTVQPQFGAIIADTIRSGADRIEAGDAWARFGDIVFDRFWDDGEPGDVEGFDALVLKQDGPCSGS